MEITLNAKEAMLAKVRKALANKDKLVGQKGTQGRNKYQMEIQKIKDQVKGFEGLSFKDLLNEVKKQEREGKFDRGAEGKAKNKLRKKMSKQAEDIFTSGRHKGSQAGNIIDTGMSKRDSKSTVKFSQDLTGTKKKKKIKTGPGSR